MKINTNTWAEASLAEFIAFDAHGIIVEVNAQSLSHLSIGNNVFTKLPILIGYEDFLLTKQNVAEPVSFLAVQLPAPHDGAMYDFHLGRHPTKKLGLLVVTPNTSFAGERGDFLRAQRLARVRDEKKAAEKTRFEAIYRQTPIATFAFDIQGKVTALSNTFLGWFSSEADALDWIRGFRAELQTRWLERINTHDQTTAMRWASSLVGMNIHIFDIEVAVIDENGGCYETYIALRDITSVIGTIASLRRQVTALEVYGDLLNRSNQRLEQFAHVTAHDLVGPLGRISTYAEILELELGTQSTSIIETAIYAIRSSALESIEIVREFLALASAKTLLPISQTLNVGQLAEEIARRSQE